MESRTVKPHQRQLRIHDKSSGLKVLLVQISDQLDQFAVYLKAWTDWIEKDKGIIRNIKNGTFWARPEALDLHVIDHKHVNHFVLRMSNTVKSAPEKRKDRNPKIDSDRNSPELLHAVKGDLCDKLQYARKEFWKVVHDLQVCHVSSSMP